MIALHYGMIFAGMFLLAASLVPIRAILKTAGLGRLRQRWQTLCALILLFLLGYASYGYLHIGTALGTEDLVVSFILMAGGVFVLAVAQLSWGTTNDIVRLASLEHDVIRDPLTGVFNRRYLNLKLEEEINRSRRIGKSLSALVIDIDHFKRINDTYGHPIGDLVPRHVCSLIVRAAGALDTVVRYGGEEFVVLAPDRDAAAACALARNILRAIAERPASLPNGDSLAVTTSIAFPRSR